ncbi:MAG: hypothetical protein JXQ83_15610 [Candidatus Glassbacteria bacterium]|nr:hypothetical protein [Candidatus Glassbacteria bacterium]
MSQAKILSGALPTVDFGPCRVTRLIVGGNPFVWNSHFTEEMNLDMQGYFTSERVVETLHRCQAAGINAFQGRGDFHRVLYYLELFRRQGGSLHFIAQTASEMADIHRNIRVLAASGAAGIYHHGTQTDKFWLEGRIDKVRDYLETMRDTGVRVGLAAHIPEIFDYVEDKAWDLDFYMVPFYNIARKPRESILVSGKFQEEVFDPEDPPVFCRFIRSTARQCLAYKIMGAGRKCGTQEKVKQAFEWAFSHIKPTDCVVVGMFPKYLDQPSLNAGYAVEAIRAAERT